jgi:RimJ/RimL family protein N-acetyltransferase
MAELEGRPSLVRALRANVPDAWPPEHYDTSAMEVVRTYFEKNLDTQGWNPWYILLRGETNQSPTAIGIFGFKAKPSMEGTVEIGYSILRDYQGKGYGTETVGTLVAWAFSHPEVDQVIAETFPALLPSIRVLEKNGFRHVGPGSIHGVIRYECRRKDVVQEAAQ